MGKLVELSEIKVEPMNMGWANIAVESGPPDHQNYDPIELANYRGDLYLLDGHHRVARAIQGLTNEESLEVEIHGHVREIKYLNSWPWVGEGLKPKDWVWFGDWIYE